MATPQIVAEISSNHGGNYKNAFTLIKLAKKAGADFVKLQTFTADSLTHPTNKKLYNSYKRKETPYAWHKDLFDYAKQVGIGIFSSPFAEKDVDFLQGLKPPYLKIASFEAVDLDFISYCAATKIPLVISLGCVYDNRVIGKILEFVAKYQDYKSTTLMHCVSKYPVKWHEMNLWRIAMLKQEFKCAVGLSDHSPGIEAPIIATTLGAGAIEKHLGRYGVGEEFALEPEAFKAMVEAVRNTTKALETTNHIGSGLEFARTLHVVEDIKAGEFFTKKNLAKLRPGTGAPCFEYHDYLGKVSDRDWKAGQPLLI